MSESDVVVVAAREAWPEYLKYRAYVCQPRRPFRRGTSRIAFYCGGAIQPLVPVIEDWLPEVLFTRGEAATRRARGERRVSALIDRLLDAGPRTDGSSYGVMLLSGPDDDVTVELPVPILNDSKTPAGRGVAWTRWQRYVGLSSLGGATRTSDLGRHTTARHGGETGPVATKGPMDVIQ